MLEELSVRPTVGCLAFEMNIIHPKKFPFVRNEWDSSQMPEYPSLPLWGHCWKTERALCYNHYSTDYPTTNEILLSSNTNLNKESWIDLPSFFYIPRHYLPIWTRTSEGNNISYFIGSLFSLLNWITSTPQYFLAFHSPVPWIKGPRYLLPRKKQNEESL